MTVRSAWLGNPLQLFEIDVAISCDPYSRTAPIHVILSPPPPAGLHRARRSDDEREPVHFDIDLDSWTPLGMGQSHVAVASDFLASLPENHRTSLIDMARGRVSRYERLDSHSPSPELRRAQPMADCFFQRRNGLSCRY